VFGRHGDADAGPDTGLESLQLERGSEIALMMRSASVIAPSCCEGPPSWMMANSSPPEPRQQVGFAKRGFQPAADFDQKRVAGGMAELSLTALKRSRSAS